MFDNSLFTNIKIKLATSLLYPYIFESQRTVMPACEDDKIRLPSFLEVASATTIYLGINFLRRPDVH